MIQGKKQSILAIILILTSMYSSMLLVHEAQSFSRVIVTSDSSSSLAKQHVEAQSKLIPQADGPPYNQLVHYWAPVWFQDTDNRYAIGDYITNFNYDGNWAGNDNWDNLNNASEVKAYIYYSVVETGTHWFIGYYDFHPRDWALRDILQHENDMEGAMVVVKKTASEFGEFICLLTEAHNYIHPYKDYDSPISNNLTNGYVEIDGDVNFYTVTNYNASASFDSHGHPIVYVEAMGHGVTGHEGWENSDFPGGDGIVYLPEGTAEEPASGNDRNVSYSLIDIKVLWDKREGPYGDGEAFGSFGKFDGNDYGTDSARAPWSWDNPNDGPTVAGEIFYNPADLVDTYFNHLEPFSHYYVYNPYAVEVLLENYTVHWDRDNGDKDSSDGHFNLYLFDGNGKPSPGDGALDANSGTQYYWFGKDMTGKTLDMREEIPRAFYGIRYPDKPYFGIRSRDWDRFGGDDWLMDEERTHWYGPTGTSDYGGYAVEAISAGVNFFNWTGSEAYISIDIESTEVKEDWTEYVMPSFVLGPNTSILFVVGTAVILGMVFVQKRMKTTKRRKKH